MSKSTQIKRSQPTKPISVQSLKNDLVLGFLLFVFTLAAYQPAWNGKPLWDDDHHITRPALRSIQGPGTSGFLLGATQQYYPLVHSVFWLEYHLWGDSTLGYHLVNILIAFLFRIIVGLYTSPPGNTWCLVRCRDFCFASGTSGIRCMDYGIEKHAFGCLFFRHNAWCI